MCVWRVSLSIGRVTAWGKKTFSLSLFAALLQNGPHTLETHSYSFHCIQATMAFVKTKDTLFLCPSCGTISILQSSIHKNTHIDHLYISPLTKGNTHFIFTQCRVWGGVTIHFNLPEGANAAAKGLKVSTIADWNFILIRL